MQVKDKMVLQMLADSGKISNKRNSVLSKVISRANTRKHEDLELNSVINCNCQLRISWD